MRVLLISPLSWSKTFPQSSWMPLGAGFVASELRRRGHTVSVFDRLALAGRIGPNRPSINKAMLDHVHSFRPELIGFHTSSPTIYDTAECVSLLEGRFHGLMVAGGHHATALPELTLERIPGLTAVVKGEGEIPMARIADSHSPETIPGVLWKKASGEIAHTSQTQTGDLDSFSIPAYYVDSGFKAPIHRTFKRLEAERRGRLYLWRQRMTPLRLNSPRNITKYWIDRRKGRKSGKSR